MDSPLDFWVEGEYCGKVCYLRKSLYDLKQSPRSWFSRFNKVVLSLGFIIHVYVDDDMITRNDAPSITKVKQTLTESLM